MKRPEMLYERVIEVNERVRIITDAAQLPSAPVTESTITLYIYYIIHIQHTIRHARTHTHVHIMLYTLRARAHTITAYTTTHIPYSMNTNTHTLSHTPSHYIQWLTSNMSFDTHQRLCSGHDPGMGGNTPGP